MWWSDPTVTPCWPNHALPRHIRPPSSFRDGTGRPMTGFETALADARAGFRGRWWQLVVGVICMAMIANLQYGWTLFVNPIDEKHHWGLAAIQVAFTIFIVLETWLVPVE